MLDATRRRQQQAWSLRMLVALPLGALLADHLIPLAGRAVANATGDLRPAPAATRRVPRLGRLHQPGRSSARCAAAVRFRLLPRAARRGSAHLNLEPRPPRSASRSRLRPCLATSACLPVRDRQLRRDYLSPDNETVSFTPAIDRGRAINSCFATRSHATAGPGCRYRRLDRHDLTRRWASIFPDINTIEQLVVNAGYDSSSTTSRWRTCCAGHNPDLPRSRYQERGHGPVPEPRSLEAHIDSRTSSHPLFAYLAPMNVHILNTRTGSTAPREDYPGFFAPYASRLQRLDDASANS